MYDLGCRLTWWLREKKTLWTWLSTQIWCFNWTKLHHVYWLWRVPSSWNDFCITWALAILLNGMRATFKIGFRKQCISCWWTVLTTSAVIVLITTFSSTDSPQMIWKKCWHFAMRIYSPVFMATIYPVSRCNIVCALLRRGRNWRAKRQQRFRGLMKRTK